MAFCYLEPRHEQNSAALCSPFAPGLWRTGEAPLRSHWFLTNNFPGNWRITRFISRLSRATETAEAGRPLRRITSSMLISSGRTVCHRAD